MIYGYTRGSTNKQMVTTDIQEEKIRAYAKLHEIDLAGIISDDATTSKIPLANRAGGEALESLIGQGKVKAIIITKIDRAFRNAKECLERIEVWDKHKVELHILDFGGNTINTQTSTGKLIFTFFAAVAEWERAVIAERTKAAHMHNQEKGKLITRPDRIPYGYRLARGTPGRKDGEIAECLKEQEVIMKIVMLYDAGVLIPQIIRGLKEENMLTRCGRPWQRKQIEKIIARAKKALTNA